MIELSVIIPAFNEARVIADNIGTVEVALNKLKISYEIICVNDGSTDNTLAVLEKLRGNHIKVLSYPHNQGKGHAVRLGMRSAVGKYHMFMDADLATSLESIEPFLGSLRRNVYDMVIGDRESNSSKQRHHQPVYRRMLGRVFTLLSSLCVGANIYDFTCGFKMFAASASKILFDQQLINNWAFDTEIIYIAVLNKLRIGQIPVAWKHQPNSKVRAWRDVFTSLAGLARIKYNAITGRYKIVT